MLRNFSHTFAMLLLLLLIAGCGSGSNKADSLSVVPRPQLSMPEPALELPPPSELVGLLRDTSAADPLRRLGSEFEGAMPSARVTVSGPGALFESEGSSAFSDLAFALYSFDITDYSGSATIGCSWTSLPEGEFAVWLALSDFENNRWKLYNVSAGIPLRLADLASFADGNGNMFGAVILSAAGSAELAALQVGEDSGFDEIENNDSFEEIQQFLSVDPGVLFVGALGQEPFSAWPDGDLSDWYGISAEAGQVVTVQVRADYNTCNDFKATLRNAAGEEFGGDSAVGSTNAILGRTAVSASDLPLSLEISSETPGFTRYVIHVTIDSPGNGAPHGAVTATPRIGNAPLLVEFDASESSDNQGDVPGTIVNYKWDWDGDLIFEDDSGNDPTNSHEYTEEGVYRPLVLVTDDQGFIGVSLGQERFGLSGGATVVVGSAPYDEVEDNDSIYHEPMHSMLPALPFSGYTGSIGFGSLEFAYDGDNTDNFAFNATAGEKWTLIADFDPLPSAAMPARLIVSNAGNSPIKEIEGHDRLFVGFTAASTKLYNLRFYCNVLRDYSLSAVSGLPPQVALSIDGEDKGAIPLTVDFTATASDGMGALVSYEWDFDRDGVFDLNSGTDPTVSHTYTTSSKFRPLVRVTDAAGFYGENQGLLYVYAWPFEYDEIENFGAQHLSGFPIEDFTGNVGSVGTHNGDSEDAYSFEGLEQGMSIRIAVRLSGPDADRTSVGLRADNFNLVAGLPLGATEGVISYNVSENDELPLTLRFNLSDSIFFDPLSADYSFDVSVLDESPVAALTSSTPEGSLPLQVDFDASGSSDPDGITKYEFDPLANGEWIDNGMDPDFSHTYSTAGSYLARVRITDGSGYVSSNSAFIQVKAGSPLYSEIEDNDSTETPQALPAFPFTDFRGSLGAGVGYEGSDGDTEDYFTFSGTAGQTLNLECICDRYFTGIEVAVSPPDDEEAAGQDLTNIDPSDPTAKRTLAYVLPVSGIYRIAVTKRSGGMGFGDYVLSATLE